MTEKNNDLITETKQILLNDLQSFLTAWNRNYATKPIYDVADGLVISKVGDTYSLPFPSRGYSRGLFNLYVKTVSGTSPTLVPSVETSEDGKYWFHNGIMIDTETEGDLTRLTAPTYESKIRQAGNYILWLNNLADYFRIKWTVAGTTPVFNLEGKVSLYA